ncbi:MAG: hypothetical protein OHK0039_44760 [Bacteroidia bacterium]
MLVLGLGTNHDLRGQQCAPDACKGPNLIFDGNFERSRPGNLLFETDYTYVDCPPNNYQQLWGRITLQRNPDICYPLWSGPDRTYADAVNYAGQMLIVDFPSNALHQDIWRDVVTVEPGATYCFSAWARNLNVDPALSLPQFRFMVGNTAVGNSPGLPTQGAWTYYGFIYTVPAGQTSLQISIQNMKQGGNGNDMAIDDIEFRKLMVSGVKPMTADDNLPVPPGAQGYPLPILANDDPALTYADVSIGALSDSSAGTLSIDAANGQLLFSPAAGYVGSFQFKYLACNNSGCCSEAIARVSVDNVLPVSIGDLTARSTSGSAYLDWKAYGTHAQGRFWIERSREGAAFERIGWVADAGTVFSYEDPAPGTGVLRYRLIHTDGEGRTTQSPATELYVGSEGRLRVYPNPQVQGGAWTLTCPAAAAPLTMTLLATDGRLLYEAVLPAGETQTEIATGTLPAGIYLLHLVGPGFSETRRLVLAR